MITNINFRKHVYHLVLNQQKKMKKEKNVHVKINFQVKKEDYIKDNINLKISFKINETKTLYKEVKLTMENNFTEEYPLLINDTRQCVSNCIGTGYDIYYDKECIKNCNNERTKISTDVNNS